MNSYSDENRRLRTALLVALLLVFVAAALPATSYAAPQLVSVIQLRNVGPLGIFFFTNNAAVTQTTGLAPSPNGANDGTFFVTTAKVNLTGFTRACFALEYEGTPVGWTFNVGDDSTADGFGGGGPGLSSSTAEVQILEEVMTMFSIGLAPGVVDQLAIERLRLLNGAFKICVGDDLVTWGNPSGEINTTNSQIGFQIPDLAPAGFLPAGNGNRDIFVGFNQVASGTFRNGVGLARVFITLE